jgi:hypothetical protein
MRHVPPSRRAPAIHLPVSFRRTPLGVRMFTAYVPTQKAMFPSTSTCAISTFKSRRLYSVTTVARPHALLLSLL